MSLRFSYPIKGECSMFIPELLTLLNPKDKLLFVFTLFFQNPFLSEAGSGDQQLKIVFYYLLPKQGFTHLLTLSRLHCRGHTRLPHPLQPQVWTGHGVLSARVDKGFNSFIHLLIHLVITVHQGCIMTFVGCRYFAFVGSFLYKSIFKIIFYDCVSMRMTTIQAGFIIIQKLLLHFSSDLKKNSNKWTDPQRKQTHGYQRAREG